LLRCKYKEDVEEKFNAKKVSPLTRGPDLF
jgi:hypothetical protein